MVHLANLVSAHACTLIYKQYQFALKCASYAYCEAVPGIFTIKNNVDEEDYLDEPAAEYSINSTTWRCSCKFMCTHLLPCRHVLYLRKALSMESVIPTQCLEERWLISTLRAPCLLPDFTSESFSVASVPPRGSAPWDVNRKYREAK
ncbi:hypothetical protein PF010_g31255 [Phytophthora fragariae]|uniref:SWIM-type domain-containing protein n=1 Tax=Phytophthora fragariae TaxID=53985 RepID=A0A6G0JIL0_9STRA|nr:hypothetical protein PF010_g31255 [Phytophthora fragariae]